jgi:glutamine synthetase
MLSMYELDGSPNDLDPRHVLRRVLDRYAADGLTPVAACELEFYLVDLQRGPGGEVLPARSVRTGRRPEGIQVYGLPELEDHAPFLRELWATADIMGLPLEGAISEFAPAQLELTLHHKPDAMAAADDAVRYKRAVKGIAPRHGCEATFMAKPWADRAGSGFHVHVSFADASGANLCADLRPEGSDMLRHAIGGMKALMGDCMAILAPNANSYRRFRANSYAPVAPTWGVNNRTVSLRVPAGPGADAHPHLVLAAVLASAHHGLTQRIDPGPAVEGDGYAAAARDGARLPTDWVSAVDRLEASDVLREYLGPRFVDMYVAVKRTEQDRFGAAVTALDYDWYLGNA